MVLILKNNAQDLLRMATGHEPRRIGNAPEPGLIAAAASIGTSLPTAAAASTMAGTASSSSNIDEDSSSTVVHNFRLLPPVETQE